MKSVRHLNFVTFNLCTPNLCESEYYMHQEISSQLAPVWSLEVIKLILPTIILVISQSMIFVLNLVVIKLIPFCIV